MYDNVASLQFTTKHRLRELFSTLYHLHEVFTWVLFASLLPWKLAHAFRRLDGETILTHAHCERYYLT